MKQFRAKLGATAIGQEKQRGRSCLRVTRLTIRVSACSVKVLDALDQSALFATERAHGDSQRREPRPRGNRRGAQRSWKITPFAGMPVAPQREQSPLGDRVRGERLHSSAHRRITRYTLIPDTFAGATARCSDEREISMKRSGRKQTRQKTNKLRALRNGLVGCQHCPVWHC